MIITSSYFLFFSTDGGKNEEDCDAIFGTSSNEYEFAQAACTVRMWSYITGIILIVISILGPVILGLIDYTKVLMLPRRRAWVSMPEYWSRLVDPANPKYRSVGATMTPTLSTGNGYQRENSFFAFKQVTVASNQVHQANV